MRIDQSKSKLPHLIQGPELDTMGTKFVNFLLSELDIPLDNDFAHLPSDADVRADVYAIYKLFDLQKIIRFHGQKYWENESRSDSGTPGKLHLENVAAHTFHVATAAKLLAPYFEFLNKNKVLEIALLHDQPEIYIGDRDPVGDDGQGLQTHAFNFRAKQQKIKDEIAAIEHILEDLRPALRNEYRQLFKEFIDGNTIEARFVKAVDKFQALTFVRTMKRGRISANHLSFTIRYVRLGLLEFPLLKKHYMQALFDLLRDTKSVQNQYFETFCEEICLGIERSKTDKVLT